MKVTYDPILMGVGGLRKSEDLPSGDSLWQKINNILYPKTGEAVSTSMAFILDDSNQAWDIHLNSGNLIFTDKTNNKIRITIHESAQEGQWVELSPSALITNYSYRDYDFEVRKQTAGVAFKYDAGYDEVEINSKTIFTGGAGVLVNTDWSNPFTVKRNTSTSMSNLLIETNDGVSHALDFGVYSRSYSESGEFNDESGNPIVEPGISFIRKKDDYDIHFVINNISKLRLASDSFNISTDTVFNELYLDKDFEIRKLTSGIAFKYNASEDMIDGDFFLLDSNKHNNIIGKDSGNRTLTGQDNLIIGRQAGLNLVDGYTNIFLGALSGKNVIDAFRNIGIGYGACQNNFTENNVAIGYMAMVGDTSGGIARNNVAIGAYTLSAINDGYSNIAIGYGAGKRITTGFTNTFVGNNSFNFMVSGGGNVGLGSKSGFYIDLGNSNIAIGQDTLLADPTYRVSEGGPGNNLTSNIAIGRNAFYSLRGTSAYNIALGVGTARKAQDISYCSIIGQNAGYELLSGIRNTFLGEASGRHLQSGGYNTFIGVNAGYNALNTDRNVFIGYGAGFYETGSDKLFIDNQTRSDEADARLKAMIYGEFNLNTALQNLVFNANVTIKHNLSIQGASGWTGTFTNGDGKTVTVTSGIITNVV